MRLDAAFDCAAGELVALVGPSGSGKTSVLRAIAGLLPADGLRGRVAVGERLWFDAEHGIALAPQQRRVGLVFQSYALFPHLTAMQNVALAASHTLANGHLSSLFERLGLAGLEGRRPSELSGGQQQRVALARAVVRLELRTGLRSAGGAASGGVLLLDEPFSAVDAPTRQTLYRELAALRQSLNVPMVLVTHDLYEARRLADRVVILDGGSTLQSGTPAQVFASPRNARVAELVGIQNHFKGRFERASSSNATLHWASGERSLALQVQDKGKIADGAAVTWVLASELLDIQPVRDAVPQGANTLVCTLTQMLGLGEISRCTLEPAALAGERITLNLASSLVRNLRLEVGSQVRLRVPPNAVHIMPLRTGAAARAEAALRP